MKRRRCRRKIVPDKSAPDALSPAERVCEVLRDIQWETNCSTLTLQSVLNSLRTGKLGKALRQCEKSGEGLPRTVKSVDQKMRDTVCLCCCFIYAKL